VEVIAERDGSWLLHLDGVAPGALLRRLVDAGAELTAFEEVLAPMEEVFVRVVEGSGVSSGAAAGSA
jgi:hypothetical protein